MKRKHVKPKSPRAKVLVVIERLEKVVGAKDAAITTCAEHAYCSPPD
jgi:hypothetical protein